MLNHKRLPRKLKKQLKKNLEQWQEYLEKRKVAKEKHESLDIIFDKNYEDSQRIIRRMIHISR